jgi:hypothetical protein
MLDIRVYTTLLLSKGMPPPPSYYGASSELILSTAKSNFSDLAQLWEQIKTIPKKTMRFKQPSLS